MKNHKQNNRKPALEESLKARQEGRWTRSKSWGGGGKGYNRKDGKRVTDSV